MWGRSQAGTGSTTVLVFVDSPDLLCAQVERCQLLLHPCTAHTHHHVLLLLLLLLWHHVCGTVNQAPQGPLLTVLLAHLASEISQTDRCGPLHEATARATTVRQVSMFLVCPCTAAVAATCAIVGGGCCFTTFTCSSSAADCAVEDVAIPRGWGEMLLSGLYAQTAAATEHNLWRCPVQAYPHAPLTPRQ